MTETATLNESETEPLRDAKGQLGDETNDVETSVEDSVVRAEADHILTTENPSAEGESRRSIAELASALGENGIMEALEFLVRSAPSRELWKWLSLPQNRAMQTRLTKGFQRTATALRQPPVRHRLERELLHDLDLTAVLFQSWSSTEPDVINAIRAYPDETDLIAQLAQLWGRFGGPALFWALLNEDRRTVLEEWNDAVTDCGLVPVDASAVQEAVSEKKTARKTKVKDKETEDSKVKVVASPVNDKWRKRADTAEKNLKALQAEVHALRIQHERDLHELKALSKAAELRFASEHEKHLEAEKHYDRANRKLKSVDKQIEEFEAENKRLKKQVRQQQELNEEQKKELTAVQSRLCELEKPLKSSSRRAVSAVIPSPVKVSQVVHVAPASSSVLPHDQAFTWTADGRIIKVTTREVKRAVDKNDESFVFGLIQSLRSLKQVSPDDYRLLLTRLREIDRYYSRVVSERTTRVLVDASNVARYEKNRYGKGQIRLIMAMRDELRRRNCFPVRFIADASLPHNIDAPEDLMSMVKRGEMELGLSGQEADDILAREARRSGAFVISNDRTFHHKASPGFEPPRVGFHFFDHHVVVDDF